MTLTKKNSRFTVRAFVSLFLLFIMAFQIVTPVQVAHAGITAVKYAEIQMTIDCSSGVLVGSVISDSVGRGNDTLEAQRYTADELKTLCTGSINDVVSLLSGLDTATEKAVDTDGDNELLALTFPGKINTGWLGTKVGSTRADIDRATLVKDSLLYDFNAAFAMENPNAKYTETEDFKTAVVSFLNKVQPAINGGSTTIGDYTVTRASSADADDLALPDVTSDYSDFLKFTPTSMSGSVQYLMYRIPKGYVNIDGRQITKATKLTEFESDEDAPYITWAMLAYEAFSNYCIDSEVSVTPENVSSGVPGSLEKSLVEVFQSVLDGITGLLGLWSLDNLIYSTGTRGVSFVYGAFPNQWEPVIWTIYFVMELIAIALLFGAIILTAIKKALSTVNPIAKVETMEKIQDLFLIIVLLSLFPLALKIGLSFSFSLSNIFYSAFGATGGAGATDVFKTLASSSGTLAGLIISLVYLGAVVYYNVYYCLRGFFIALAIIIAPVCIVLMAFGGKRKEMTKTWAKELLAQIFIQPIHALVLTVVLLLPTTGRSIETIVCLYALIPISQQIRSIFFGTSGSMLHKSADSLKNVAQGVGVFAAGKAFGAVTGGVGGIATAGLVASGNGKDAEKEAKGSTVLGRSARAARKNTATEAMPSTAPSAKDIFLETLHAGANAGMAKAAAEGGVYGVGGKVKNVASAFNQAVRSTEHGASAMAKMDAMAHNVKATGQVAAGMAIGGVGGALSGLSHGHSQGGQAISEYGNNLASTGAKTIRSSPYYTSRNATAMRQQVDRTALPFGSGSTSERKPDGSVVHTIPQENLAESGIASVRATNNGVRITTTDTGYRGVDEDGNSVWDTTADSTMSFNDRETYAKMADTFEHGTEAEKQALRDNGYDSVAPIMKDGAYTGKYTIETNENFKQAHGYDMDLDGDGDVTLTQSPSSAATTSRLERIHTPAPTSTTTSSGSSSYTSSGAPAPAPASASYSGSSTASTYEPSSASEASYSTANTSTSSASNPAPHAQSTQPTQSTHSTYSTQSTHSTQPVQPAQPSFTPPSTTTNSQVYEPYSSPSSDIHPEPPVAPPVDRASRIHPSSSDNPPIGGSQTPKKPKK